MQSSEQADDGHTGTVRVRVLHPEDMWKEARSAYLRTGGGDEGVVVSLLGTRENPDLDACLRELVGDAIVTESFEIL